MWVNGFNDVMELHGIGQNLKRLMGNISNENAIKPTDKVLQEYLRVEHDK